MKPVIVVHGGAGNDFDDRVEAFRQGVERAARAGWQALLNAGSAVDAVEMAVRVMEDDPNFDAGHGSFLNANNEVEMDAMIMEGGRLGYGAVAGIQRVSNPVSVARLVMEHTPHSLVVGAGAEQFARSMGVPVCPMEALVAGSSTHLLRPEDRIFRPPRSQRHGWSAGPGCRRWAGGCRIDRGNGWEAAGQGGRQPDHWLRRLCR